MTKRTIQIEKEIYNCDCCGVEFEENKSIFGTEHEFVDGEYVVVFEPKVFGDYCMECTDIIQINWDFFGSEGLCSDRYDDLREGDLKKEIQGVKKYVEKYKANCYW